MKPLFSKSTLSIGLLRLFALIAVLGLAVQPFASVSAAAENLPLQQTSNERLERAWAHQLRVYERMGYRFDRSDFFMENAQSLIDRAAANGKDGSAVQAALDAFEAATEDAQVVYESSNDIIDAHEGFDKDGKVTDPEKAQETVDAMRAKLEEIKDAMDGTGRALHEAIKAFREANPRPQPTPNSTSS